MGIEENKAFVLGFFEAAENVNGDLSKIPPMVEKYISPDHIHHRPDKDTTLEETLQFYDVWFTAFPDLSWVIEDVLAEGDKVIVRYTNTATHKGDSLGMPATGKKIKWSGIDIFRVADGKITDEWSYFDQWGQMQQLGVIPTN